MKPGLATTAQSLSGEEADVLIRLIYSRNPELEVVWRDVELNLYGAIIPDIDLAISGREGQKSVVRHFVRERDRGIIEARSRPF